MMTERMTMNQDTSSIGVSTAEEAGGAGTAIGVIGLGAMGRGMAASLRRAGYHVHVCDVRAEAAQAFAAEGGTACASPAAVAARCEIVVSVVVNAAQTEAVLFGEQGAAAQMRPGSLFVMCSTVDPNWSVALEQRLAERGLLYLDAPISGGAAKAASGQMTMMTAGTPAAYAKAGGALAAMAAQVYRLGDRAGNGSKVKIINQLLAGVHIAAAAEAMALGLREGVDPAALYEVITHSAGNSWMFENRMAHVLAGDYTPLSAVDIFVKDLGLVLDTARASKFPLPLSATAHQMFMQASSAGFAREDDSAVIKIFPGITLPERQP
jgi:putative dehydrogenase